MTPLPPNPANFAGATVLVVLADAALKGAVLLLLAVLASPLLRKASASARHALWCGALAGVLLLPVLSLALPAWRVPWLPEWRSGEQGAGSGELQTPKTQPSTLSAQRLTLNAQVTPPESANLTPATVIVDAQPKTLNAKLETPTSSVKSSALKVEGLRPLRPSPYALRPFLWAWLIGSLVALIPLLAGWWQAARLTRRGKLLDKAEWSALLAGVSKELKLRRKVRVLAAPGTVMPFTWGAWRTVVIFPEAVETWTLERRRLVLLHELGHVKRLDWLTQTLGTLACALYWFNPLAWIAARHMRLEREQACDDLVLRCGSQPRDYARELLEIAAGSAQNRILNWVAVPVARHSKLETRLRAILDGTRNRRGLTRLALLGLLALVAAVVIPVAMLRAGTPTPEVPSANPISKPVPQNQPTAAPFTSVANAAGKAMDSAPIIRFRIVEITTPPGVPIPREALDYATSVAASTSDDPKQKMLDVLHRQVEAINTFPKGVGAGAWLEGGGPSGQRELSGTGGMYQYGIHSDPGSNANETTYDVVPIANIFELTPTQTGNAVAFSFRATIRKYAGANNVMSAFGANDHVAVRTNVRQVATSGQVDFDQPVIVPLGTEPIYWSRYGAAFDPQAIDARNIWSDGSHDRYLVIIFTQDDFVNAAAKPAAQPAVSTTAIEKASPGDLAAARFGPTANDEVIVVGKGQDQDAVKIPLAANAPMSVADAILNAGWDSWGKTKRNVTLQRWEKDASGQAQLREIPVDVDAIARKDSNAKVMTVQSGDIIFVEAFARVLYVNTASTGPATPPAKPASFAPAVSASSAPAPLPITARLYLLETPPGHLDPATLDPAKIKDLPGVTVLAVRDIAVVNGQELTILAGMVSTRPSKNSFIPNPLSTPTFVLPSTNTFTANVTASSYYNSPVPIPAEEMMTLQPLKLSDGIHYRARFVIHWGRGPMGTPLISSGGYDAGIEFGSNFIGYTSSDTATPGRPVIFELGETGEYLHKNVAVLVFDAAPAAATATPATTDSPPGIAAPEVLTSGPGKSTPTQPTIVESLWVLDVPENEQLDAHTIPVFDLDGQLTILPKAPDGVVQSYSASMMVSDGGAADFIADLPFTGRGPTIGSGHTLMTGNGESGSSDSKPKMNLSVQAKVSPAGYEYAVVGDFAGAVLNPGAASWHGFKGTTTEGLPAVFDLAPGANGRKFVGVVAFKMVDPKLMAGTVSISPLPNATNAQPQYSGVETLPDAYRVNLVAEQAKNGAAPMPKPVDINPSTSAPGQTQASGNFQGFIEYGGTSTALPWGSNASVQSSFEQPVFDVRNVNNTTVTVFDGATVLPGSVPGSEITAENLGEIPPLGRLFQRKAGAAPSKGTDRSNFALLIGSRPVNDNATPKKFEDFFAEARNTTDHQIIINYSEALASGVTWVKTFDPLVLPIIVGSSVTRTSEEARDAAKATYAELDKNKIFGTEKYYAFGEKYRIDAKADYDATGANYTLTFTSTPAEPLPGAKAQEFTARGHADFDKPTVVNLDIFKDYDGGQSHQRFLAFAILAPVATPPTSTTKVSSGNDADDAEIKIVKANPAAGQSVAPGVPASALSATNMEILYFPLKNSRAQDVTRALNSLIKGSLAPALNPPGGEISSAYADTRTNSIIFYSDRSNHEYVKGVVERLDMTPVQTGLPLSASTSITTIFANGFAPAGARLLKPLSVSQTGDHEISVDFGNIEVMSSSPVYLAYPDGRIANVTGQILPDGNQKIDVDFPMMATDGTLIHGRATYTGSKTMEVHERLGGNSVMYETTYRAKVSEPAQAGGVPAATPTTPSIANPNNPANNPDSGQTLMNPPYPDKMPNLSPHAVEPLGLAPTNGKPAPEPTPSPSDLQAQQVQKLRDQASELARLMATAPEQIPTLSALPGEPSGAPSADEIKQLLVRGRAQYLYGDYSDAAQTFKLVLQNDPQNIEAQTYLEKIGQLAPSNSVAPVANPVDAIYSASASPQAVTLVLQLLRTNAGDVEKLLREQQGLAARAGGRQEPPPNLIPTTLQADPRTNSLIIQTDARNEKFLQSLIPAMEGVPAQFEADLKLLTVPEDFKFPPADWKAALKDNQLADGKEANVLLNRLTQNKDVDLMSAPSLAIMNNEPATVTVGQQINLPDKSRSGTIVNQAWSVSNSQPSVPVGVTVNLTPSIAANGIHYSLKLTESKVAAMLANGLVTDVKQLNVSGVVADGGTQVFELGPLSGEKRKRIAFLTLKSIGPGGPELPAGAWRLPDPNYEKIQLGMTQDEVTRIMQRPQRQEGGTANGTTVTYRDPEPHLNTSPVGYRGVNEIPSTGVIESPADIGRFRMVFGADGKLVSKDDTLADWLKGVPHPVVGGKTTPPTPPALLEKMRQHFEVRIQAEPEAWARFLPAGK